MQSEYVHSPPPSVQCSLSSPSYKSVVHRRWEAGAPVSVSFKQSVAGDSPGPSCSEMFNFVRELLTGLCGLAAAHPCPSQPLLFSLPLFPGALWNALDRRVDHKGTIGLLGQLCLARRLGYAGSTQK